MDCKGQPVRWLNGANASEVGMISSMPETP